MFVATDLAWKELTKEISYRSAKQRTPRDGIGTAYWQASGTKHHLWVKVRADRWLCFTGRSVAACLALYARTPGAGGPANDHLIANGIATIPGRAIVLKTAQLGRHPGGARRPRQLSERLTPDELWRSLQDRGAPIVRRPVSAKAIEEAEVALQFRFPPSYVELVTRNGAPALGRGVVGRTPPRLDALAFAVLTPLEVVRFTKQMRRLEIDMFEDPASLPRVKTQLANAVLFQLGRDAGEGYVFLVDTADAKGEMRIGDFSHDYLEELDWKPSSGAVFRSLSVSTLHAARQIERDLPEL